MYAGGVLNSEEYIDGEQLGRIQYHYFGEGSHISKAEMIQIRDFLLAFQKIQPMSKN